MSEQRPYRGKHIETGEWIYGSRIGDDVIVGDIVDWDEEYFCTEFWYKVDPATVGQYTGLTDCKDNLIYEKDIFLPLYNRLKPILVTYTDGKYNISGYDLKSSEVIGNIHDHPHLLKGDTA